VGRVVSIVEKLVTRVQTSSADEISIRQLAIFDSNLDVCLKRISLRSSLRHLGPVFSFTTMSDGLQVREPRGGQRALQELHASEPPCLLAPDRALDS